MTEALGDLRVAVQVDPGGEHRGLLDEGAQDHVAAVRPAEDRELPVRPRLFLRPAAGVDEVVDVGVTPLIVVGAAEVAAVAGRTPEIDVEEREALARQQQLERLEVTGRTAMSVRRGGR